MEKAFALFNVRDINALCQHILTLRTQLGLSQMGLVSHLGVSRKAVAW